MGAAPSIGGRMMARAWGGEECGRECPKARMAGNGKREEQSEKKWEKKRERGSDERGAGRK